MHGAYYSSVLNHPADHVWGLVRDFNSYPRWVDGATESLIENDKRGDEVGAVRRFCYDGAWVRQRLTAHSDTERSFGYAGMEPFPFPAQDSADAPGAVEYAGRVRLTPIIDGNRTFIEWWWEFECPPIDTARWQELLREVMPQWVDSLRRALDGR